MPGSAAGSQLIGPHINESFVEMDGWSVWSCPGRDFHSFSRLITGGRVVCFGVFLKVPAGGGKCLGMQRVYNYIPGTQRGSERPK